jgi:hypothetical protein
VKAERKAEQRQMQDVIKSQQGQIEEQQGKVESQQWQIENQQGQIEEQQRQIQNLTVACENSTAGQRLQDVGPSAASDFVRIFKRTMTTSGGADGHRRLRVLAEVECSKAYIKKQTNRINDECCDEPSEDCSGGIIGVCNAGCAALVNPLWAACQVELGPAAAVLAAAADRCSAPPPPAEVHTVKQIFVTCPSQAVAADCVPRCGRSNLEQNVPRITNASPPWQPLFIHMIIINLGQHQDHRGSS